MNRISSHQTRIAATTLILLIIATFTPRLLAQASITAAASAPISSATSRPTTAPARSTTIPSDSNARQHAAWFEACQQRVAAMKGKPVDIIFIGDSITENFVRPATATWKNVGPEIWQKHYAGRNVLNFGVGADGTEHVLWRLEHQDIAEFHPKVAVILIGTNNTRNTPEQIADGVNAVIGKTQQVFPGVKIILISILPNARATQKMAQANEIIRTFGDDRRIFYFDLASKMPREGNTWKGLGSDRLHLSPEGYELWASEMEPLLSRLLGSAESTTIR